MAKNDSKPLTREDFDAGPRSFDEIEPNLFLSNLTVATDVDWLRRNKITHILTVESFPLPQKVTTYLPDITLKYIQVTDMPREDLLNHFESSSEFIRKALESNGKVLVHCYFGMSRSATLVIAYIMKKYRMGFNDAYELVRQKRRFVCPNLGFQAQLKLYEEMGFCIDNKSLQYKMYRLQGAADKVRKAKILPQSYFDLIKPDPALTSCHPEPTVYRCKKCRRVIANASNVLPHMPKEKQIWRHVSGKGQDKNLKQKKSIEKEKSKDDEPKEYCSKIYFVEPLAWMPDIMYNVEGKLNCPKCATKLGSFSWVSGCQCPCGSKIAPAFYLVPSKVDWSNAVQNVESTI